MKAKEPFHQQVQKKAPATQGGSFMRDNRSSTTAQLQLQAQMQAHTLQKTARLMGLKEEESKEEEPIQALPELLQRAASGEEEEKPLQRKFESDPEKTGSHEGKKENNTGLPDTSTSSVQETSASSVQATQRKSVGENRTGLPDALKTGIENLSGHSMDDVKVHYNSPAPAQLQAHAYAQGTDIHIAPGQEKHLPHEAWHVVQQKQGRVQPTTQLKGTVNINDDAGLEKEANVMGEKANTSGSLSVQAKKEDTFEDKSNAALPRQLAKSAIPAPQNIPVAIYKNNPVQLASAYNGPAISAATGAWGPQNIKITDKFTYGAVRAAENTALWAHAEIIGGDWSGAGVSDAPTDWEKFTQLVGPYSVKHLVQGHMVNERMGGNGNAENLAPLTSSANTRHWNSVESPIKAWLDADKKNLVDYKVTPQYTGAKATLKTKLINEFKTTHTTGTSDTAPNLRTWLGNYIDATIPSHIDIEVYFMQANGGPPYAKHKARRKPLLQSRINNGEVATFVGPKISGNSGAYSNFNLGINNQILYGGANGQNAASWGHAKRIDNLHFGSGVASQPTNWDKFTQLVGPDAVNKLVQGHLINQKIGGQGINQNLTPLTTSANSLHSSKVETPIKNWLKKPAANNAGPYLVDYKVTPTYGAADAGLKKSLLGAFDDTNAEIRGDTQPNLTTWLNTYIDNTFPEQLDVSVTFMKANEPFDARTGKALAKAKPALNGNVTNEPA